MIQLLGFVAVWLGIMALIGAALALVARMSRKKDDGQGNKNTQDIADK